MSTEQGTENFGSLIQKAKLFIGVMSIHIYPQGIQTEVTA
jgi:hypothetical protein